MRTGAAALLTVLVLLAGAARAQEAADTAQAPPPQLTVSLYRDSITGALNRPIVQASGLMRDNTFTGALRNGFPVRFAFRLSLWRDAALFDRLEREAEWDAVVVLDPVDLRYQLLRSGGSIEAVNDLAALTSELARPFTVDLLPAGSGNDRFYYVATLTIESLSLSVLEEVERWLTGDLGRAITQRGDVGNAFSRGARLALIRLSGLPRRVLTARTGRFTR